MSEKLLHLIEQYLDAGKDFGETRTLLKISGYSDETINQAFNEYDNRQLHKLYLKQEIIKARGAFIGSLIISSFAFYYDYIQFSHNSIYFFEWSILALALSISSFFYLKRVKSKFYSISRIIRENRWSLKQKFK